MLQFGEKHDLILVKKMQQFSKSIESEKNIRNYIALRVELKEKGEVLFEKIKSVRNYYNDRNRIDFNEKNKSAKLEIGELIRRFISVNIIPTLLSSGFFEDYKLNTKIDRKTGKVLHNYFD